MELKIYQVDAFADKVFKGNPAAVVPLREWLPDEMLLNITRENNLSETAFFVPKSDGYELRWFTTAAEIDLCGHATLASAFVLFRYIKVPGSSISFYTRKAGKLLVSKEGEILTLDFPVRTPEPTALTPELLESLNGIRPKEVLLSRDYVAVFDDEEIIRHFQPDFQLIEERLNRRLCITAPGKKTDFVSRFFCPADEAFREDPVTGSAHCSLVPYWAKRLGKTEFLAAQLSARGGMIKCRLEGDRVYLSGKCVPYLVGRISVD
jgi:PhzF family phenazine biosynthesis protein